MGCSFWELHLGRAVSTTVPDLRYFSHRQYIKLVGGLEVDKSAQLDQRGTETVLEDGGVWQSDVIYSII